MNIYIYIYKSEAFFILCPVCHKKFELRNSDTTLNIHRTVINGITNLTETTHSAA
jgi:hypothetical protein